MSKLIKIGDTPFMVSLDVISSSLQNILLDEIKHKCSVNELILEDNKLIYVNHRKDNIIVSDNKTIVNLYKAITYLDDYNDKDVSTIKENTKENGYEYVDLGLPSGTLWATCNVGANSPTEYGKYFAWGETVGYYDQEEHTFDWNNYKYGDADNFTKYNAGLGGYGGTIDNKVTLDLADDAVHVNMGGDWHMPTNAQLEELINETNQEWVTNYQGSGINGRLFISKNDPSKSIFIPASGYRWDSSVRGQGSNVYLWSSSLTTEDPYYSGYLYFGWAGCYMDIDGRCGGFCLRGVKSPSNNKEETKENGYEYVDLDLPSGTLWATCNVGANSPTECGKYFAWGDAVGYYDNEEHNFSWDVYKYGDGSDFTKYNATDGKTILDLEDDAVHVEMGGDWHMPTSAQMEELFSETNHEWIKNYQGSNINGRLFTSKIDSTKSIFIPASGYRWGDSVYHRGSNANLWSSSLLTGYFNDSWGLYFDSGDYGMGDGSRYNGFCLRGVIKKNNI